MFVCSIQVVEDGYEFFAKRQLVTLFSAPNYCGDYDNAGGMMTVDEELMCSFQVHFYRCNRGMPCGTGTLWCRCRLCNWDRMHACMRVGHSCSMLLLLWQILKPSEKKAKYQYTGVNSGRPPARLSKINAM